MHASPAHTPPWQAHNGTTPRAALALLLGLALLTPSCADGGSSGGGGTAASSASASSAFVVSTSPRDGDFDVPVGHTLELVLSQEVNPATVDAQTVRVERNGVDVGCERIVQGSRIWLKPRIPMLPTTAYRIVATSGIQTFAGDVLETTTIGFTTGPGPNVRGPILMAGAGVADLTPPVGVPVGGYGSRRLPQNQWNFSPQTWHTMFKPSTGVRDPIMAKAVVLDDGVDRIAIVTLDLIASDSRALDDVARKLAARGVQIDRDKIMTCASHTHSGPGAISELYFWMYAALDMYKPALFDQLTTGIADAIERAVNNLQPAKLGLGLTQLSGIGRNRRANLSPHYDPDDVDEDLGVIRVDALNDVAIATVYNYAVHVSAFSPGNLHFSADLSGDASRRIEGAIGGVALFVNGAEGDIAAAHAGNTNDEQSRIIGTRLADGVLDLRSRITPDADVDLESASQVFDFGQPAISISNHQGNPPPYITNVLSMIPVPLGGLWVPLTPALMDRRFRFQAIRVQNSVISSIPGEAIHQLGIDVKSEGAALGFDYTFVAGLANSHMSYITTEQEYDVGGYEAFGTLYGRDTGPRLVQHCAQMMRAVRP